MKKGGLLCIDHYSLLLYTFTKFKELDDYIRLRLACVYLYDAHSTA